MFVMKWQLHNPKQPPPNLTAPFFLTGNTIRPKDF